MQIGFAVNEILFLATLSTGALAWAWRRRKRIAGHASIRKPWWVTYGGELFAVCALMLTCRVAVADWPRVPSGSMEPTLRVGDYLFVNHLAYGPRLPFTNTAIELGRPQRGDVVVFRYPTNASQFYVKRLIGLPGDRVAFADGLVTVNGQAWHAQRAAESMLPEDMGQWIFDEAAPRGTHAIKVNPFVRGRLLMPDLRIPALRDHCRIEREGAWQCEVPAEHYLMLGDNRDNSVDSRVWGFLPHQEVYGKATHVLVNFSDRTRTWKPL